MKTAGMKASKRRIRPGSGLLFAVTVFWQSCFWLLFFAIISAFKSNGDILKNPMSLPASLYLKTFRIYLHSRIL